MDSPYNKKIKVILDRNHANNSVVSLSYKLTINICCEFEQIITSIKLRCVEQKKEVVNEQSTLKLQQ